MTIEDQGGMMSEYDQNGDEAMLLTYRGILDHQGTVTICSGWTEDHQLARFAADWRMVNGLEPEEEVVVPLWAILSIKPAFEAIV